MDTRLLRLSWPIGYPLFLNNIYTYRTAASLLMILVGGAKPPVYPLYHRLFSPRSGEDSPGTFCRAA